MRSVIHNYIHNSKNINGGSESVALRSAFLISNQVLSTGCSYGTICYDKYMRSMSTELKLMAMEQRSPDEFKEMGGTAAQMLEMIKQFKKTKHPTPAQIIALKKLEKSVNTLWEFDHVENLQKLMLLGMPQLEPLVNEDTFTLLSVHSVDPELDNEYFYPNSKIFALDFEEDEAIDIFFLPVEFHEYIGTSSFFSSSKAIYSEDVLTFTNINALTAEELKSVKAALSAETMPLCKKADEWIKACVRQSPKETRRFFNDEIKPLMATLQEKINEDIVLQHVDTHYPGDEKPRIGVIAGETSLRVIWDFYRDKGIVHDTTWNRLQELDKQVKKGDERVPFFANKVIAGSTRIPAQEKKSKEEVVLPLRKTLDID